MVEISSFKEAFQLYQTNQLPRVVIQNLAYILMSACEDIPPNVQSDTDINTDNLLWLANQLSAEFNFHEYLGGNAYICESAFDLTNIKAFDPVWADVHGEWPDVTDQPMVWDVCYTLDDHWAVFCCIWNNAGGDTYYVPSALWQQARLAEHLALNPG